MRQERIDPRQILQDAADEKFCDVVVIGIKADASLYVRWSGTTLASLLLFLKLGETKAMEVWAQSAKKYAKNCRKQGQK